MAFSVVETKIVNPAKKGRSMAKRKMTAKQIRFFGTKRQRAALKAKRSKPSHRARTSAPKRNPPRRKPSFRKHKKRNPAPEIISLALGNPARKRGQTMAKTRKGSFKRKHRAASRSNAGRRTSVKTYPFRRGKRNPGLGGLGTPMQWVKGGVSVLGGVVVTRALPQAVAAQYNTGGVGYAMNAGAAIAATWAAHAFFKDPVVTGGVAGGGFAAIIARMISDMTSFGQYLSLTGMGDYQFSNFVAPQRLIAMKNAQVQVPTGWGGSPLPALTTGLYGDEARGSHC